jgi:hypothetical protein
MSWSTIATAEVLEQFTPQEQSALQSIQGSTSNLDDILAKVVNMVRGYILGGGNVLDAANTIPDQLRMEVVDIARWRWLNSFPQLKMLQTEGRQKAYEEAMKTVKEVGKKNSDIRIEQPASATAVTNASPVNSIAVVSTTTRQNSRCETNGL